MNQALLELIFSFGISLFCSFFIFFIFQRGFFLDYISDSVSKIQASHNSSIPRVGGLGIFLGSALFLYRYGNYPLLFTSIIIFCSGFLEDIFKSLSPKIRLFVQVIAASIIVFSGVIVQNLGLGFTMPFYLAFIASVFMIVGISNAINIIDGMNLLAGLHCLFVVLIISVVAYFWLLPQIALLSAVIACTIVPFLIFNIFGKMFLGDGGAYFLGFILSVLLIVLVGFTGITPFFAFNLMIYPIVETIFSIFRRKLSGQKALNADNLHLHTLIFSTISQKTSTTLSANNITGLLISCFNLIFIIATTIIVLFTASNFHTLSLIAIDIAYILLYLIIYFRVAAITSK